MSHSQHILTDFEVLFDEGQRSFSLISLYKGVPVNTSATLQGVDKQVAWFHVPPPGLAFAQPGAKIFVISNGFLEPVDGRVVGWDHETTNIGLSDFTFAGGTFANRHELRVQPEETFSVTLVDGERLFQVEGIDISLHGLGLMLRTEECPAELTPGKELGIEISFPARCVGLRGRILRLVRQDDGWRIPVEFTCGPDEKKHVLQYIMLRRDEIFSEINRLHS